jgi:hypothetical protein
MELESLPFARMKCKRYKIKNSNGKKAKIQTNKKAANCLKTNIIPKEDKKACPLNPFNFIHEFFSQHLFMGNFLYIQDICLDLAHSPPTCGGVAFALVVHAVRELPTGDIHRIAHIRSWHCNPCRNMLRFVPRQAIECIAF